jgi:hypothetical protein
MFASFFPARPGKVCISHSIAISKHPLHKESGNLNMASGVAARGGGIRVFQQCQGSLPLLGHGMMMFTMFTIPTM